MFKRAIPWSRQCYQRGAKAPGRGRQRQGWRMGMGRGGKGIKKGRDKGIDTMAIVSRIDRIIHNFSL